MSWAGAKEGWEWMDSSSSSSNHRLGLGPWALAPLFRRYRTPREGVTMTHHNRTVTRGRKSR